MLFTDIETIPVTILNTQSLSAAVPLGPKSLVGIVMPAAWTAADLTFQGSVDGTTFDELTASDLTAAGTVATLQVHSPAAAQFIGLDPAKLRGVNQLKVRSGTSGTPVAQGADRVLTLIVRGIL